MFKTIFFLLFFLLVKLPFFLEYNRLPKCLFVSFLILFFLWFVRELFFNNKIIYIFVVLFLLFIGSIVSGNFLTSIYPLLFLSVLLIFLTLKTKFIIYENNNFLYLKSFIFVVLLFSFLGVYEFFSYGFTGSSDFGLIPYVLPRNHSLRVSGFLGQPNLFALFLLSGLLAFMYYQLHLKSNVFKFVSIDCCTFFVISLVLFLTGSRAGFLALLLTMLLLCWLVARDRYLAFDVDKRKQFVRLVFVLFLSYLVSCGLNYAFADSAGIRSISQAGISADARFVFWTSAILIFLDHPLFGVGLGNFKFYLPQYANQAHDLLGFVQYEAMVHTDWAHNELLQLLCEGGVFVFLIIVFLLGCFFYQFYLYFIGRKQWSPLKLYSHLFLLPFMIQSMFSWPMRHPVFLVLFFLCLVLLLSQYSFEIVIVPKWGRLLLRSIALCGMVITLYVGYLETRLGVFAHNMNNQNIRGELIEFQRLATFSYLEYPLLSKILPRYIHTALINEDVDLAESILPYVETLVDLQGTHSQWYGLSSIYHLLDRMDEADVAIKRAIFLNPTNESYRFFQHYLNMLKISKVTGRSFEYHPPPMVEVEKGSG